MNAKWKFGAVTLSRAVLGIVLVIAGIGKIADPYAWLLGLYEYDLVGPAAGARIAGMLPWAEMMLGLGLLLHSQPRSAGVAATMLFTMFATLHVVTWARGLNVSCACFGGGEGGGGGTMVQIGRSLGLLACACIVAWGSDSAKEDVSCGD